MATTISEVVNSVGQSTALSQVESSRAVAEVQAALVIARANPRDEKRALDRIGNACQRQGLAEVAVYSYSKGGTDIEGPSIRLAECLAQCWGNIQYGIRELDNDGATSTCQAYAWDVETNTRREMTFVVKHKRTAKGETYDIKDPREQYENFANLGARRVRSCIIGVIPRDVVDAAVDQCNATMRAKADCSAEAVAKMLSKFAQIGVTRAQIEKRIQRRVESIQPAQVVGLRKIYNSINDGISSAVDWFETEDSGPPKAADVAAGARSKSKKKDAAAEQSEQPETPPHLMTVLADVRAADSEEQLEAIRERCAQLSDDDFGQVMTAIMARSKELQGA